MPKVLLVEDDNNLREIYEARLQAEGFNIVSAKDGEEALVVAKAEKPDLIISDVMMPKISGFEMLDILRNTPDLKDIKIIMLTALGQAEDQGRANQLGADRYLVKSQVTLEDIVKQAHDLLQDQSKPDTETPSTPGPAPGTTEDTATQTLAENQVATPAPVPAPAPAEPSGSTPTVVPVTEEPSAPNENPIPVAVEPVVPEAASPASEPSAEPPVALTEALEQATPEAEMPAPVNETGKNDTPAPVESPAMPSPEAATESAEQLSESETAETSEMDQKINDFLSTAQDSSTLPPPDPSPTTTDQNSAAQSSNDATLAQAVDSLMTGEETSNDPPPQASGEQTPAVDSAEAGAETTDPTTGTGSSKRIIQPLNQQPGTSLNDLVAQETASESAANDQLAPEDRPSQAPPTTENSDSSSGFDPSDPNNIAI